MTKLLNPIFQIALFGVMLYGAYLGISRLVQVAYFIH